MHFSQITLPLSVLLTSFTANAYSHNAGVARRAELDNAYTAGFLRALARRDADLHYRTIEEKVQEVKDKAHHAAHKATHPLSWEFPDGMQKGTNLKADGVTASSFDLAPKPISKQKDVLVPGTKEKPEKGFGVDGGPIQNHKHFRNKKDPNDQRIDAKWKALPPPPKDDKKKYQHLFDNVPNHESNTNKQKVEKYVPKPTVDLKAGVDAVIAAAPNKKKVPTTPSRKSSTSSTGSNKRRAIDNDFEWDLEW